MNGRRAAFLGAVLLVAACVEQVSAPGHCPSFCPSGQIQIVDTVLSGVISRDSAYRGYVGGLQSPVMLVADLPGFVDSRGLLRFNGSGGNYLLSSTDTGHIVSADSARLTLTVARRDTGAHNLTLEFFRMPVTVDTTTTFAALAGPFAGSPVKSVNVDTLLAQTNRKDTLTGDSVVVDTVNHLLVFNFKFDTAAARYSLPDSGTVAYGIRVTADSLASIAITRSSLTWHWFVSVDSAGTILHKAVNIQSLSFSNFVFDPPAPPTDSTLAVGGVPSARSILRVAFPRFIRDSSQVIRGTLILIPAAPAQGARSDSFPMEVHTVYADFGVKSPIIVDATRTDTTMIRIGATDTLHIEMTNLLQYWAADTTRPTTLILRAQQEAQAFAFIRLYPSLAAAYRPTLRITYLRPYPFGKP